MRIRLTPFIFGAVIAAQSLQAQAQEPKFDSATVARANKPIFRKWEVIGVVGTTAIALAFDKSLLNTIHDPTAGHISREE